MASNHPAAPRDSRLDHELMSVPRPAIERQLVWNANHAAHPPRIVEGGLEGARVLLAAVDGGAWPWTSVDVDGGGPRVQVLGGAAGVVLEVTVAGQPFRTVARVGGSPGFWALDRGARHWVPNAQESERFTTTEAAAIGVRWLRDGDLPEGLEMHGLRYNRRRL